jgi:hypothetical protein
MRTQGVCQIVKTTLAGFAMHGRSSSSAAVARRVILGRRLFTVAMPRGNLPSKSNPEDAALIPDQIDAACGTDAGSVNGIETSEIYRSSSTVVKRPLPLNAC